jgi:S1-C subfamily serine protease
MPDYSFQDGSVRADGVSDDRPAQKAGIKAGDIIIQLGEFKVSGMQSYMEALGKFKAGQTITVTILRDGKQIQLPLTFQ